MDDRGTATTYFFTPDGGVTQGPNMAHARWYPTVTVLEDGRVLTMGGRNEANAVVKIPEIWENGPGWSFLARAQSKSRTTPGTSSIRRMA